MRDRAQGFTLLEVVVAIAIFAAMYVLAQYAFTQALDHRDALREHSQQQEVRQRLLLFLSQDIEQIIARPVRDGFGELRPALHGDEESITFTRLGWANALDLRHRSQLQRVTYAFEENTLVRYHWPYVDRTVDTKAVRTELIDGVEKVRWRYLMQLPNDKWEWQEFWPLPQQDNVHPLKQSLPRSIELTLEFENGEQWHRFFRLVVNPWE